MQLPEQVVALHEVAGAAFGTGMQVMQTLFEEDVTAIAGAKGKHDPACVAVRHGSEAGRVTLGGRRVAVQRPRVRSADGRHELPVSACDAFASRELLTQMALEQMLAGLSTRRYASGLEPVSSAVEERASGTSRSVVSRRFVQLTPSDVGALTWLRDATPRDAVVAVTVTRAGSEFTLGWSVEGVADRRAVYDADPGNLNHADERARALEANAHVASAERRAPARSPRSWPLCAAVRPVEQRGSPQLMRLFSMAKSAAPARVERPILS